MLTRIKKQNGKNLKFHNFYFYMAPYVDENGKKNHKKMNFEKQKKWSGDTVPRYHSTKFGVNLLSKKMAFTDGRSTGTFMKTVGLLCSSSKQS